MSTFAIAIRTFDRTPRRNYLDVTLANLRRAGAFADPRVLGIVVADSGGARPGFLDEARRVARVVEEAPKEAPRTPNKNAAHALRLGAALRSDWVMFLEDDVDFIADVIAGVDLWLARRAVPGPMVYPLCAAYAPVRDAVARGSDVWDEKLSLFYGTQGFVVPTACALELADAADAYGRRECFDFATSGWAASRGVTHFRVMCPSVVQHIGVESSLHGDDANPSQRFFDYVSWPGKEWRYT